MEKAPEDRCQISEKGGKHKLGFTLVELSIAIAVLSVMAMIFAPVISQGIDMMLLNQTQETRLQEARRALAFITGLMQTQCCNVGSLSATTGNVTALQFGGKDGNLYWFGYTNNPSNSYSPSYRRIEFLYAPPPFTTYNYSIIADNVKCLQFAYFNAVTNLIPTADSGAACYSGCSNSKIMQIAITIGDGACGTADENDVDLITRVKLDN